MKTEPASAGERSAQKAVPITEHEIRPQTARVGHPTRKSLLLSKIQGSEEADTGLIGTSLSPTGVRTVDASIRRSKRALKWMLALCGYEVYRTAGLKLRRRVCIGNNLLCDVRLILGRDLRCMIDGGAHFGETALNFAD